MKTGLISFTLLVAALGTSADSLLRTASGAAPEGKTIQISARRFSYNPAEITLKVGDPVTLVMRSEDVAHGLRVREFGLDLKAAKGASAEATVTPQKPGDFIGHCSVFCGSGHGAMTVTFHVVP